MARLKEDTDLLPEGGLAERYTLERHQKRRQSKLMNYQFMNDMDDDFFFGDAGIPGSAQQLHQMHEIDEHGYEEEDEDRHYAPRQNGGDRASTPNNFKFSRDLATISKQHLR